SESLETVVESCVNFVGVDLNRASSALLQYVSGFNRLIARRVVAWREEHGPFAARAELLDVPGIGRRTFTQSAGFLKIAGGDEPLDATWVHPESYAAARALLRRVDVSPEQVGGKFEADVSDRLGGIDLESLAGELGVGSATLEDMAAALLRPQRDPRSEFPGPVFKRSVLSLDDLEVGMELTGTVQNVVDFGAFVDIGLKNGGLVHISRMSEQFVKNPHDVVAIGDLLTVWVEEIDRERGRVSLTMVRPDGAEAASPESAVGGAVPARARTRRQRGRGKS
ncbi:MAG: S1 RNA-binding domain-containing protein, partial [Planctomycetota bacterium]